ncbi:MAG TPA: helix-turn-helix transcriptional regulator [Candidatus Thermoplasmatota archaeon]|nr:helix-turn-helix transcriptional regulator [Candidatus Thermoplasmatota archaeon]
MNIGETKEKILHSLEAQPSHGYKLSKILDVPLSTIYGHLKEFRKRNIITPIDEKNERRIIYQLTEKGKRVLQVIKEY